jgi:hypothetical protein
MGCLPAAGGSAADAGCWPRPPRRPPPQSAGRCFPLYPCVLAMRHLLVLVCCCFCCFDMCAVRAAAAAPWAQQQPPRDGGTTAAQLISHAEVRRHQSRHDFWAVVDSRWVVNVTAFLPHHPGGVAKILGAGLGSNFSFSRGPNAHFAETAKVFAEAARRYERQAARPRAAIEFTFWRSRGNGGLDRDGRPAGPRPASPVGAATILGTLAPEPKLPPRLPTGTGSIAEPVR